MIGRAWSVKRWANTQQSQDGDKPYRGKDWVSGTAYEYGLQPPRYLMPATSLVAVLSVPPEYVPFKLKARELRRFEEYND